MLTDVLLFCDMTTGPGGDYVRPADRLVEIRGRYGPDHEVTRFVSLAASGILSTATSTTWRDEFSLTLAEGRAGRQPWLSTGLRHRIARQEKIN